MRNPPRQRVLPGLGEPQPQFASAPEHVVGGAREFLVDHVADLAFVEVGAEMAAHVGEAFDAVPFFWSQHYDLTIRYVGYAEHWDAVQIDGALDAHDCAVTYMRGNQRLAVATISRDRENLVAEVALERSAEAAT